MVGWPYALSKTSGELLSNQLSRASDYLITEGLVCWPCYLFFVALSLGCDPDATVRLFAQGDVGKPYIMQMYEF